MEIKPIRNRVVDAFDDATAEGFGEKYLDFVVHGWTEVERTLRRTVTVLLTLIMAFLLLVGAKEAEFSLGPFKVTNLWAVLTILPALASIFAYEFAELLVASRRYRLTVLALVGRIYPRVREQDLDLMLGPPLNSVFGDSTWLELRSAHRGRAAQLRDDTSPIVALGLMLAVLAYFVYAYIELFSRDETSLGLLVPSAVFVLFNLARAVLVFVDAPGPD